MSREPSLRCVPAGVLANAYYEAGPVSGTPPILLHGFPYDAHAYDEVISKLVGSGYRVWILIIGELPLGEDVLEGLDHHFCAVSLSGETVNDLGDKIVKLLEKPPLEPSELSVMGYKRVMCHPVQSKRAHGRWCAPMSARTCRRQRSAAAHAAKG